MLPFVQRLLISLIVKSLKLKTLCSHCFIKVKILRYKYKYQIFLKFPGNKKIELILCVLELKKHLTAVSSEMFENVGKDTVTCSVCHELSLNLQIVRQGCLLRVLPQSRAHGGSVGISIIFLGNSWKRTCIRGNNGARCFIVVQLPKFPFSKSDSNVNASFEMQVPTDSPGFSRKGSLKF